MFLPPTPPKGEIKLWKSTDSPPLEGLGEEKGESQNSANFSVCKNCQRTKTNSKFQFAWILMFFLFDNLIFRRCSSKIGNSRKANVFV